DINVGQSKFRCDLAVRSSSDALYQLGVLIDTDGHYANPNLLDRYLMQPSILRAFGWRFALVLTKDWYHTPEDVLNRLEKLLQSEPAATEPDTPVEEPTEPSSPAQAAKAPEAPTDPVPPTPKPIPAEQGTSKPASSPPASSPSPGSTRHFEFISGASNKFWEISVSGNSFTVRFGRIGTPGQSQTKSFEDDGKAKREAEKLIAEKIKKGYTERCVG
ncbi:MAG TPA: WGR domain-containing protein, partial [Clostridia bacterium]|nr:WGR domain-containing protein [Clostridia bacterium]